MSDFYRLLPYVRPHTGKLTVSLLLLVLAGLAEVLTTGLALPLFDSILLKQPEQGNAHKLKVLVDSMMNLLPGNELLQLSLALLILTAAKGLCLYFSNYKMSHVGQSVVMQLRNTLNRHVLSQSLGFFSLNSTGRLISRMNSDVEQVQEAVSTSLADLFRESVLLVALVAWVFYIDWMLASLAMLIAPAALGMTLTMGRRIRHASLRSRENVASLSDLLQQSISGVKIVKAFGMERHEETRFGSAAAALFRSNMRAARILFLNSPVMELLAVACFIPLLYYAHSTIAEGRLTLGVYGASLFSLFRMYDPIRKLSRLHVQFQRAFASAGRIMELLDTHVEIHDRAAARPLENFSRSIEFRDVSFDYRDASGTSRVLRNINLLVERRMVVALVGSSGSGKSTLVSLIPRFYDVAAGAVLIDGTDVRDLTQESLRRHISLVTQDTFLFNDTVRNNIAYGDIRADEKLLREAAEASFAHEFIMQLPMRYETVIGERGQRLSGGERQRISIARAILKNAPILILDEATSALDSESERLVQRALSNLMRDRTTFVIAHRLSTIRSADLIVVLQAGRIVEAGTHESLLDKGGLYDRFHRLQTQAGWLPVAEGAAFP